MNLEQKSRSERVVDAAARNEWGCLPTLVTIGIAWFMIFGATIRGKHYEIDCSCDRGVELLEGVPEETQP